MWSFAAINTFILSACLIFFFLRGILGKDTLPSDVAPSFAEQIPNRTVVAGREVIFRCVVNDLGDYKLVWLHNDRRKLLTLNDRVISPSFRYRITHNDHRTWWLTITDVEVSDKGEYMCQLNTVPVISQSGYLDVVVPPKIDDEYTSYDTEIIEGSDVSLRCRASGNPTPIIRWRREDGKDIQAGINSTSTIIGEYLNITKASRLSMGAYLCAAFNGIRPSVSKRIMLNVNFAPMISVPNQLINAPLDTDVDMECEIESYPKSVTYWIKDNDMRLLTGSKYIITYSDSRIYKCKMSLRILNLKQEDYGSYTCVAENSIDEAEGTIKLYETPLSTTVFSPSSTSNKTSEIGGTERNENGHHLNNGMDSSGTNILSNFVSSVIAVVGLLILLQVL